MSHVCDHGLSGQACSGAGWGHICIAVSLSTQDPELTGKGLDGQDPGSEPPCSQPWGEGPPGAAVSPEVSSSGASGLTHRDSGPCPPQMCGL